MRLIAAAHKVEAKSPRARPRADAICEKSIARALLTTNKVHQTDGRSPIDLPQLYEQLRLVWTLLTSSVKISAKREGSDDAIFFESIARSPLDEKKSTSDDPLAAGRKLTQDVNKALLYSLKRTLYLAVLFLLSACSAPLCPKWTSMSIDSPCVKSTRWTYPSLPDYQGLSLEYTLYPSEDRFFLNLPCVLPTPSNPIVTFHFATGELTVTGELYEGGQRIAFPPSVNLPIFEALDNGEPFTVRLQRWTLEVNNS